MRRCLGILKPQLTPVEEDTWEEIDTMQIAQGAQYLRWLVWVYSFDLPTVNAVYSFLVFQLILFIVILYMCTGESISSMSHILQPTIDSESLYSLSTECPRITLNPTASSHLKETCFLDEVSPDIPLDNFVVKDIDPTTWSVRGHAPKAEPSSPSTNPNELSIAEKFRLAFAERDARLAPKRAKNARQHIRRSAREWMKDTDAKSIVLASQLSKSLRM